MRLSQARSACWPPLGRQLVLCMRRHGNQAQHSSRLTQQANVIGTPLRDLPAWAITRVTQRLDVSTLARTGPQPSNSKCASHARHMLQPRLQPLEQLDHLPRRPFVLRLLLGYTADACSQLLGIQKSEMPAFIEEAVAHLNKHSQRDDCAKTVCRSVARAW